jgi:hypothetical protein
MAKLIADIATSEVRAVQSLQMARRRSALSFSTRYCALRPAPHLIEDELWLVGELPIKRGCTEVSASFSWQRWCRRQAQHNFITSSTELRSARVPSALRPRIRKALLASVPLIERRKPCNFLQSCRASR